MRRLPTSCFERTMSERAVAVTAMSTRDRTRSLFVRRTVESAFSVPTDSLRDMLAADGGTSVGWEAESDGNRISVRERRTM